MMRRAAIALSLVIAACSEAPKRRYYPPARIGNGPVVGLPENRCPERRRIDISGWPTITFGQGVAFRLPPGSQLIKKESVAVAILPNAQAWRWGSGAWSADLRPTEELRQYPETIEVKSAAEGGILCHESLSGHEFQVHSQWVEGDFAGPKQWMSAWAELTHGQSLHLSASGDSLKLDTMFAILRSTTIAK